MGHNTVVNLRQKPHYRNLKFVQCFKINNYFTVKMFFSVSNMKNDSGKFNISVTS